MYSDQYHVDENELKKIAQCESGFNPNSNNSGLYLGMFQFAASSWSSARSRMGLDPNPDLRTNAEESIKTAAYMIANGGINAWPNCK
jgi:soluble lytic murein transglycosylase-like protein